MPFRPSKWAIYAPVAVLPFLAALFIQGKSLQGDLEQRVAANLSAAGAVWAKPVIEGRDVRLSGDSPSAGQVDAAIAAVLGTTGVRRVESSVRVVEPPPAAPTIKPQSGFWGTFDITGTWPEGNGNSLKVQLGDSTATLGSDSALGSDGKGNWTLKPVGDLAPGVYDMVVTATSASGLSTPDASTDEITVAVPPELKPATIEPLLTSKSAPEIRGTFDPSVATSLTVALGDTLYKFGGSELVASGPNWTLVPLKPLADGTYDATLEVGDALGRKASSTVKGAVVIDTVPPSKPIINPFSSELPLVITGTWPGKDAVSLAASLAGKSWKLGNSAELTSDGQGNWSFAPALELSPGTYELVIETADRAGNTSRNGAMAQVIIPEPPPPPPLPELLAPTVQSLITNAAAAVIRGTWPSDVATKLTVKVGEAVHQLGTSKELSAAGNDWTLSLAAPLADGDYPVSVEVGDAAGRTMSLVAPGKLTIDTVAPAAPVIDPVEPVLPLKASGSWIEGDAVSLIVRLAGQVWKLGQDAAIASDGAGKWSFTPQLDLPPGTYDLEVEVTDAAGNMSRDATRDEVTIAAAPTPEPPPPTPEPPPPPPPPPPPEMTVPTITPAEEAVARPVIKGTWSEIAATSLKVEIAGTSYLLGSGPELTSDGIGNWALALPAALADGIYDVAVSSTDASGKTLSDTTQNEIVIDAKGPASPTVSLYAGENSPTEIRGTWDWQNATALRVGIPAANIDEPVGTALMSDAGNWTLRLASELEPGSYDVTVEAADAKGRFARDQTRFEVLVKGPPEPPPPPRPPAMKAPTVASYEGVETPKAVTGTWDEGIAKSLVVTIKRANISASLGIDPNLTSDGKGNWSLAFAGSLPPGIYDVVAETLDEAGNNSTDQSAGELVIVEAPPPPPPPPPPYDCEGAFANVVTRPLRFPFDSWKISSEDAELIRNAAAVLSDERCLDRKAEVSGHADYLGGRLYNRALSIRRAQVVVDALTANGVSPARINITGLGEQSPDVPDRTRDARQINRRVIITMVK